jgi:hypothetical protein
MRLQASDIEALENSNRLLKFVSEHRKQAALPQDVVAHITKAWEQSESGTWDPDAAKDFWLSYSALCDLAQPATIDTIQANAPVLVPSRRQASRASPVHQQAEPSGSDERGSGIAADRSGGHTLTRVKNSLSRRFGQWCMSALVLLLMLVVMLGYVASSADALTREIRSLMSDADKAVSQVRSDIDAVASELVKLMSDDKFKGDFDPVKSVFEQDIVSKLLPSEVMQKIASLRAHLQDLYYLTDTMYQKVQGISAVIPLIRKFDSYDKGDLTPVPMLRHALDNVTSYYQNRRTINEKLQAEWIWITLYNAIVPMLLGALGASSYVVRLISDQIRETTFSETSPIRHVMRMSLGALAGVIIGFGGIVTGTGLSSAALAFIAGYAVEPVFSTFDSIAEKFRNARQSDSAANAAIVRQ